MSRPGTLSAFARTATRRGSNSGLPGDELDRLNWAALLHDIGKLEVSARRSSTSRARRRTRNRRALRAASCCTARRSSPPCARGSVSGLDAVGHHHERWDGTGTPWTRWQSRSPRAGRIVAIVRRLRRDHFVAVVQGTGERYRRPRRARAELGNAVRPPARARIPGTCPWAGCASSSVLCRGSRTRRCSPAFRSRRRSVRRSEGSRPLWGDNCDRHGRARRRSHRRRCLERPRRRARRWRSRLSSRKRPIGRESHARDGRVRRRKPRRGPAPKR